ncbi:MAG: transcriptional regulator [Gammaproteobacteria bacterium]|nr:transcriptional regulator [Gammaproteobacteria bacterium]
MGSILLGDALFTKTQQKVLGLLFGKPDETFYFNEIVRLAEVGKGAIKRELESMLAAGLVTVTRIGNQNHYQANAECPIYVELQEIVRKTFGVTDVLKSVLVPLSDSIDFAFVYGSIAKGNAMAKSDIDLMVISESLAYADLMTVLIEAEQSLGRTINPTIYHLAQFKHKWLQGNAFITRVMEQSKLWIKGDESDLGKS